MAMPALPNDAWTLLVAAFMDRRQGHFDKAIQEFNEAMARDPLNPVPFSELAETLFMVRRFDQAEQAYDRVLKLLPNDLMLTIQKANVIRMGRGDASALRSAVTELVSPLDNDRTVLCCRLRFSLENHDWQEARELIDKLGIGDDDGCFTWGGLPVPIGCYSILLARLEGEQLGANPAFLRTRAELKEKVERAQADALSLVQLGLVDALLGNKDMAISEAKHAVEILPISKDALEGPQVAVNLGLVYAWTDELDLAFQTLSRLTKTPSGLYYGDLKFNCLFEPLRKDPRYEQLLEELAPKD
jgi:tetratricopeptide (TPR) repeat protein